MTQSQIVESMIDKEIAIEIPNKSEWVQGTLLQIGENGIFITHTRNGRKYQSFFPWHAFNALHFILL